MKILTLLIGLIIGLTIAYFLSSVKIDINKENQCYCCGGVDSLDTNSKTSPYCSDTTWNGSVCVVGPGCLKTFIDSSFEEECDAYFKGERYKI